MCKSCWILPSAPACVPVTALMAAQASRAALSSKATPRKHPSRRFPYGPIPAFAGGHAGYELAPFIPSLESLLSLLWHGAKPCAALNTVRHHDMHHRFPNKHFSLYFTHWDRWCGTEHPSYQADVSGHFAGSQQTQ